MNISIYLPLKMNVEPTKKKPCCAGCGKSPGVWFTEFIVNQHIWILVGVLVATIACCFGIPSYLSNMVLVFMAPSSTPSYQAHVQMKEYFPLTENYAQIMVYVDQELEKIHGGVDTNEVSLADHLSTDGSIDSEETEEDPVKPKISQDERVATFFESLRAELESIYPGYMLSFDNYYNMSAQDSDLKLVAYGFVEESGTATYCALMIDKLDPKYNSLSFVGDLRRLTAKYNKEIMPDYFTAVLGIDSMFLEIMGSTGKDVIIMVALSLPFAFLIIGVYLKSAKLIIFPLIVVLVSALISLGLSALMPLFIDVLPFVPGMQAAILLAMSIDYTLFVSSALKRELLLGGSLVSVVHNVLITGGKIVLVSGTLLLITLLSVCCMGNMILISVGLGMAFCLIIIVVVCPLIQLSLLMVFPNFFSSYSFNIGAVLTFATEVDINTFKINPNVIARAQRALDKKTLKRYNSEGKKVKINQLGRDGESKGKGKDTQSSASDKDSHNGIITNMDGTNSEASSKSNENKGLLRHIDEGKEGNTTSQESSKVSGILEVSDMSEGERKKVSQQRQQHKTKTNCMHCTPKMKFKHSFPKGDRPRIDRVPTDVERIKLQTLDTFHKIAVMITKIPLSIVVLVVCLLLIIPGAFGLAEMRITYDNLMTIPKGSDIVDGITMFGEKFSQGFVFPFTVVLSPIDSSDGNVTVLSDEAFDLSVKMIEEIVTNVNDAELLNGTLVNSPSYISGMAVPVKVAKALLGVTDQSGDMSESDNNNNNNNAPVDPEEIFNQISSAYKYICNMYLDMQNFEAMQMFLAPNIPWSAVGSDAMTDTIRAVLTQEDNVQMLQALGLRADLFSMYADLIDSGESIFAVFPILIAIILVLLMVVVGVIYKSIVVPIKLLVTMGIILVFTFGICSFIFNGCNSKEGFYWFVPAMTLPIVVGLGTDYDTFLFTSLYHKRSLGVKNRDSIIASIYDSGKTVVAAGLIMATSFIGLAFSSVEAMMQLGTILVVAVLFEALIMIPLFVPALTSLFGKATWFPHHMPPEKYDSFHVGGGVGSVSDEEEDSSVMGSERSGEVETKVKDSSDNKNRDELVGDERD